MASKLETSTGYLLSFVDGQGTSAATYTNYPQDLDTNFTLIRTTVNQMVDELASVRALDATIPTDMLLRTGQTAGRVDPSDARITFTSGGSAEVDVTAGKIYAGGQRINLSATTFNKTTLDALVTGTQTVYLNTDQTGLMALSLTASDSFFDLAQFSYVDGTGTISSFVDNLSTSESLNGADMINRIHEKADASDTLVGGAFPSIRLRSKEGVDEDAGFFHRGIASNFGWASQKDGGEGSGSAVTAAIFNQFGQLLLKEQARCFIVKADADQTITSAAENTWADIEFDTLPTSNTAAVAERFEPESYNASTDFQAGTNNIQFQIPSDGTHFDGTWMFMANVTWEANATGQRDIRVFKDSGTGSTQVIARDRKDACGTGTTVCTTSGLFDLTNGDTVKLQVQQNSGGDLDVTFARLVCFLIGHSV